MPELSQNVSQISDFFLVSRINDKWPLFVCLKWLARRYLSARLGQVQSRHGPDRLRLLLVFKVFKVAARRHLALDQFWKSLVSIKPASFANMVKLGFQLIHP